MPLITQPSDHGDCAECSCAKRPGGECDGKARFDLIIAFGDSGGVHIGLCRDCMESIKDSITITLDDYDARKK